MTKASDNVFPKVQFSEEAAPGTPSAGQAVAYVKTDGKLYLKDDAGSETDLTGTGSSGLLATTVYDPGTTTTYTTTSATLAAMDTTNLRLSFTAPSSGNVLIKLSAVCRVTGASTGLVWGLMDGVSTVANSDLTVLSVSTGGGENAQNRPHYSFLVTGLTGGNSYDFDWAHLRSVGSSNAQTFAGGSSGAAIMEAWVAP